MTIQIVIDRVKGTLQIGDYIAEEPQVVTKDNWSQIATAINIENPLIDNSQIHNDNFYKLYRRAALDLWVKPYAKQIRTECRGDKGELSEQKLQAFWKDIDTEKVKFEDSFLRQSQVYDTSQAPLKAVELQYDDMAHLLPVLNLLQTNEGKECRQRLGKSSWSAVNKNTLEKNEKIIGFYKLMHAGTSEDELKTIGFLNRINPLIVEGLEKGEMFQALERGSIVEKDLNLLDANFEKMMGEPINSENVVKALNYMNDIAMMEELVNGDIKNASAYKAELIIEKHEKLSETTNELLKYDTGPFEPLQSYPKSIKTDQGKAFLLKSPAMLSVEGQKMGHCVGGYSHKCHSGHYAVYHVVSKDNEHSTIGIDLNNGVPVSIQQQYRNGNKEINKHSQKMGQIVFDTLTKRFGKADRPTHRRERREERVMSRHDLAEYNLRVAETSRERVENRVEIPENVLNQEPNGQLSTADFLKNAGFEESKTDSSIERTKEMVKGLKAYSDQMLK